MSTIDGIPVRPNPESGFGIEDYYDWLDGLDIPSKEEVEKEMYENPDREMDLEDEDYKSQSQHPQNKH